MIWIPGGEFAMGAPDPRGLEGGGNQSFADARPIHRVFVDAFWMDATEVSNAQFEKFVKATGYVTVAEKRPTKEEFPTAPEENLVAGSVVFTPTPGPVALDNHFRVELRARRNWRHPNRSGKRPQGPRGLSGCPHRLRRRRGLRPMGRQAPADRGGVRVRRARRPGRQDLRLGR